MHSTGIVDVIYNEILMDCDVCLQMQWLMKQTMQDVTSATNILHKMLHVSQIKPASQEDLKQVFTNDTTRQFLFPGNHFNMGTEVHEAHEDSIEIICEDYRKTFIKTQNNTVNSLSIGSTFNCPAGTAYYIDYYGTVNTNVILEHLLRHLLEVPAQHAKYGGKIFLMLGLPKHANMEDLKSVVWSQLGLSSADNLIQEVMLQAFIMPDIYVEPKL